MNRSYRNIFRHFFIPHKSNNHKPKILHNDILLLIAGIFLIASISLSYVKNNYPKVLGLSVNISTQQLLVLTNQQREENGLKPLNYNAELAQAADLKADNMFAENYWAHISPSGKTPWYFIQKENYNYTYAGENLARGFTTPGDVMDAWMNSPSHRENILSPDYQDIGFSVKEGTLTGEKNTVLIVEMFGGKGNAPLSNNNNSKNLINNAYASNNPVNEMVSEASLINRFNFAKNLAQILIILFIIVFSLDLFIVQRKKIYRLSGHNLDHILFFAGILVFIIFLTAGSITP